jgi:hypothetical protein
MELSVLSLHGQITNDAGGEDRENVGLRALPLHAHTHTHTHTHSSRSSLQRE